MLLVRAAYGTRIPYHQHTVSFLTYQQRLSLFSRGGTRRQHASLTMRPYCSKQLDGNGNGQASLTTDICCTVPTGKVHLPHTSMMCGYLRCGLTLQRRRDFISVRLQSNDVQSILAFCADLATECVIYLEVPPITDSWAKRSKRAFPLGCHTACGATPLPGTACEATQKAHEVMRRSHWPQR